MDSATIDAILHLQLAAARLGEKELLFWWNTDLLYSLGGADFLGRLVGAAMAPLSAGEGLLMVASRKEEPTLASIPGESWSLFNPEPQLRSALNHRYRHFKTYPADVPPAIARLLAPEKEWKAQELLALLSGGAIPAVTPTSFGREVQAKADWGPLELAQALASTYLASDRNNYVMPYYRSSQSA